MLAIVLLVLHAVGSWTYAALGPVAAILSAVMVGSVSIFSARIIGSGRGSHAWFVVPAALFTAFPLAARLWSALAVEQTWWARTLELAPFVIGFAAPVLLLLFAYAALGNRAAPAAEASLPLRSQSAQMMSTQRTKTWTGAR